MGEVGRRLAVSRRRQQANVNDGRAMQSKVFSVYGSVHLDSPGEVIVDVDFPVKFIERPISLFGAQYDGNSKPILGAFPTINAMVVQWKMSELSNQRKYYIGATIGIKASGLNNQQYFLDYLFQGMAMVNPVSSMEGATLDTEL